jgi:hypothetical protein
MPFMRASATASGAAAGKLFRFDCGWCPEVNRYATRRSQHHTGQHCGRCNSFQYFPHGHAFPLVGATLAKFAAPIAKLLPDYRMYRGLSTREQYCAKSAEAFVYDSKYPQYTPPPVR